MLVVGVDGVRFDLLGPDTTPSICELGQAGFLTPVPVDEQTPTVSGPCWATIVTGTGVTGHGITGNDLTGHRLAEHPDFVTVATRAGLSTLLAVSGWPPLALAEDGGPLFAEAARREFVGAAETSVAAWNDADEAVTRLAAAILAADGPRLSFVYLGTVDIAGHIAGAGAVYRAAVLSADRRVSQLLDAVRSRPAYAQEGWTMVVVTDHGHLDRGGHGGREPEVATAWAAAAGPGIIPAGPPLVSRQEEIAPLVLAALGDVGRGLAGSGADRARSAGSGRPGPQRDETPGLAGQPVTVQRFDPADGDLRSGQAGQLGRVGEQGGRPVTRDEGSATVRARSGSGGRRR